MSCCGGLGEPKKADEEVNALCDSVKSDLESKTNQTFDEFTVISYVTQVVAGINYFVKVHVGNEKHYHLRIFKPLPHTNGQPTLTSHQVDKAAHDPIVYFQ